MTVGNRIQALVTWPLGVPSLSRDCLGRFSLFRVEAKKIKMVVLYEFGLSRL